MQLLSDFPWYISLLCLLAGAAYSAGLYWRGKHRREEGLPRAARVALPLLRFATVALIAFLLTAPLVRRQVSSHEKPVVAVVTDASRSVPEGFQLPEGVRRELERQYEVVEYVYGSGMLPASDSAREAVCHATDIASALTEVADLYAGRNLGAVVLTGDGIYNRGQNPATVAAGLTVPVYAVPLGDTTHRSDAAIAHVRYNRAVRMGSLFPLEVTLHASRLKGSRATLTVTHDGRRLYSKEITYTDDHYSTTESLMLDADRAGLQSYTVAVSAAAGEATADNNRRTIAVEVTDGRQRIALAAAAPHPDISALRQAIGRNPNYETEVFVGENGLRQLSQRQEEYDLYIFHNLPGQRTPDLRSLTAAKGAVPTIYILGPGTDLGRFNALHSGLEIVARSHKTDEVTALRNPDFALFTLDEESSRRLEQLPPLAAPFGDYRTAGNLQSLFTARVGTVGSDRPLVAFCQQEGVRRAFVAGEGLWRWRLQDYQMTGSHHDFDALVEKMVTYTSLQVGKERLRVTARPVYGAGEAVTVEAELYDDNLEPTNRPEATFSCADSSGQRHSYAFNRSGNGYALNLGTLPPGTYSYTASASFAGKEYTAAGRFVVEQFDLESLNLVADHALMNTIARTTGGETLAPDSLERLPALLEARGDMKAVIYSHTRYTELLDLPWLLVLLVLLMGLEWGVRKACGEV